MESDIGGIELTNEIVLAKEEVLGARQDIVSTKKCKDAPIVSKVRDALVFVSLGGQTS